jgi:hypothetical protein
LAPQRPPQFLFRGNAVAAGGFLTRIGGNVVQPDPNIITTHGESCLPTIGGVSHSLVQEPALPFPKFIRYRACETFVEGLSAGHNTVTNLRASVNDIQVTTSPSPEDGVPGVQSISFQAVRLSIAMRSTHPPKGQPYFELAGEPEAVGMFLVVTQSSGQSTSTPIHLEFDGPLLGLRTMDDLDNEFLSNREFFDEHVFCFPTSRPLVFGTSKVPRTVQGYVFGSIVKQIGFGDQVIKGNVLSQRGFGTISFGVMISDAYSRRISMARIEFGSDPAGDANFSGVETNGIWK